MVSLNPASIILQYIFIFVYAYPSLHVLVCPISIHLIKKIIREGSAKARVEAQKVLSEVRKLVRMY